MTQTLFSLAQQQHAFDISQAFIDDEKRFDTYSLEAAGLLMDYSKQNLTPEVFDALLSFAAHRNIAQTRDAMLGGEKINQSEGRAVLHTILRAPKARQVATLDDTTAQEVAQCDKTMAQLVDDIHQGKLRGFTNQAFTDVIAVGIGGSYYGPKVCAQALKPYASDHSKVHYIANVDGNALQEKLAKLHPETTLIVVISKTFVTQETLLNAHALKGWLIDTGCAKSCLSKHFIAVTANRDSAIEFGVAPQRILPMWQWVGGRFSLWSAVGLPLAIAIGMTNYLALKDGAYQMDCHFEQAPLAENMPIIMALIGVWNRSFLNYPGLAVLPYDHRLRDIPGYLQQLDMESNGKSVKLDGTQIPLATAPIVFGQEGTNSQHAFMQMMHQSNETIPSEFIVALNNGNDFKRHHQTMVANCFAQSEALMQGKSLTKVTQELQDAGLNAQQIKQLAPHKVMRGNNPSTTIVMDKLTPQTMGSLMALYEHKIFVQGILWQLNPFDQWGVELGKVLGTKVLDVFDGKRAAQLSGSSQGLINRFKNSLLS